MIFTRRQKNHIGLLATTALVLGLLGAVPHFKHTDATQSQSQHVQHQPVSEPLDGENQTSSGCDHACHLSQHFSGIIENMSHAYLHLNYSRPSQLQEHFQNLFSPPDLRPPIS